MGDLQCEMCSFVCKTKQELASHNLLQSHHMCPQCDLALSHPSQLAHHLTTVHGCQLVTTAVTSMCHRKYSCEICGKVYASAGGLHNHKSSAHTGKFHACPVCGRKFNHRKNLACHVIRHKERSIKCSQCNAAFFLRNELNKHINQVHRKCRPYKCEDCGRSFRQRSVLKHHAMIHTDHKPYTCPLCRKAFRHRNALSAHLQSHERHLIADIEMPVMQREDSINMQTLGSLINLERQMDSKHIILPSVPGSSMSSHDENLLELHNAERTLQKHDSVQNMEIIDKSMVQPPSESLQDLANSHMHILYTELSSESSSAGVNLDQVTASGIELLGDEPLPESISFPSSENVSSEDQIMLVADLDNEGVQITQFVLNAAGSGNSHVLLENSRPHAILSSLESENEKEIDSCKMPSAIDEENVTQGLSFMTSTLAQDQELCLPQDDDNGEELVGHHTSDLDHPVLHPMSQPVLTEDMTSIVQDSVPHEDTDTQPFCIIPHIHE